MQAPSPSGFTFFHGLATYTGPGALSIKLDVFKGPLLQSSRSHTQTSYAGTREFMQWRARVIRYNRLFAQSIVTRRRGVVGVFLPWGKELKGQYHEIF